MMSFDEDSWSSKESTESSSRCADVTCSRNELVTGESQTLQTLSEREGLVVVKRVRVAWWVALGPWSSTSSHGEETRFEIHF